MSEEQFDYKCKNGHDFKSKAAIRAFCPVCGESTKRSRLSSGTNEDTSKETGDSNGNAETKTDEKEQSKESETTTQSRKEPARTKVIRVKRKEKDEEVPKGKTKDEGKSKKDTGEDSRQKLIKRRRIRQKFAHPRVRGKVKTNKETQDEKLNKQTRLTTWEQIRKRAGFGA